MIRMLRREEDMEEGRRGVTERQVEKRTERGGENDDDMEGNVDA